MDHIRTKKSLGQHFLVDKNIAAKIANSLQCSIESKVLEIGPGEGILTGYLLEKFGKNFYTIDIDKECVAFITKKFPDLHNEVIHEDFLKLDISGFQPPFSIIGNFPYNISSQIFFKVLDNFDRVDEVVCMIQKEVAERITSKHKSKQYGILSVLLQNYYDTTYLFTVNPSVFNPPPKVTSAVIRLKRKESTPDIDFRHLKKIVKAAFNQRRKTLSNSIKVLCLEKQVPEEFARLRPEQLSPADFVVLASQLQ